MKLEEGALAAYREGKTIVSEKGIPYSTREAMPLEYAFENEILGDWSVRGESKLGPRKMAQALVAGTMHISPKLSHQLFETEEEARTKIGKLFLCWPATDEKGNPRWYLVPDSVEDSE